MDGYLFRRQECPGFFPLGNLAGQFTPFVWHCKELLNMLYGNIGRKERESMTFKSGKGKMGETEAPFSLKDEGEGSREKQELLCMRICGNNVDIAAIFGEPTMC